MELIRGRHNLHPRHRGCVLTIGNFDGVHQGHRAVIRQLVQTGRERGLPSVAMVFEPQPQEFFTPARAPARLTRLREKLQLLAAAGLDRVLCLRFNHALAQLSPAAFISELLVQGLGVAHIVIGDDFRFGQHGAGHIGLLQQAGVDYGFSVARHDTFELHGRRISSSRIRAALAAGAFAEVADLLGRPYRLCGRVGHGDRLGRTIGFPTANLALHRRVSPLTGVFAVQVHGLAARPLAGMANVGSRPTVGGSRPRLEVHIFDFNQSCYGQLIEVEFHHKLRDEQRFESLAALTRQLHHDAAAARALLAIGIQP